MQRSRGTLIKAGLIIPYQIIAHRSFLGGNDFDEMRRAR